MKSYSNSMPSVLEKCRGGRYLYHFNIVENTKNDEEDKAYTEYEYDEVAVYSPLSAHKLTQAVINSLWDKDYEQKLINEYNAYVLGVGDETAKDAYVAFLNERAAIKAQVYKDCKELGL